MNGRNLLDNSSLIQKSLFAAAEGILYFLDHSISTGVLEQQNLDLYC